MRWQTSSYDKFCGYKQFEEVWRDQGVHAFYEEEGHAIMDCPFVLFHIKANIARHVELQSVARTLMDVFES
jgi:hypothetical protein